MTRAQWYRLHRWIAITAGVFLLSQIISGIVMVLPFDRGMRRNQRPDYTTATVSPAQAVAAVSGPATADPALVRIAGRLVYQVPTRQGLRLIDAHTGTTFPITLELAAQIVRAEYAPSGSTLEPERLDRREGSYRGPLPVYRIRVAPSGETYYVSSQDGGVLRDTPMGRVRSFIGLAHTFDNFPVIGDNPKLRKPALAGAGMISLGAVATGYWIAWKRRKKEHAG